MIKSPALLRWKVLRGTVARGARPKRLFDLTLYRSSRESIMPSTPNSIICRKTCDLLDRHVEKRLFVVSGSALTVLDASMAGRSRLRGIPKMCLALSSICTEKVRYLLGLRDGAFFDATLGHNQMYFFPRYQASTIL